jgi:hypothetical protein
VLPVHPLPLLRIHPIQLSGFMIAMLDGAVKSEAVRTCSASSRLTGQGRCHLLDGDGAWEAATLHASIIREKEPATPSGALTKFVYV